MVSWTPVDKQVLWVAKVTKVVKAIFKLVATIILDQTNYFTDSSIAPTFYFTMVAIFKTNFSTKIDSNSVGFRHCNFIRVTVRSLVDILVIVKVGVIVVVVIGIDCFSCIVDFVINHINFSYCSINNSVSLINY
jgi:hypothetical protein